MISKKVLFPMAAIAMASIVACGDDSSSGSPASGNTAPASVPTFMDIDKYECSATVNKCAKVLIEDKNDTMQCDGVNAWRSLVTGPIAACEAASQPAEEIPADPATETPTDPAAETPADPAAETPADPAAEKHEGLHASQGHIVYHRICCGCLVPADGSHHVADGQPECGCPDSCGHHFPAGAAQGSGADGTQHPACVPYIPEPHAGGE